MKQGTTYPVGCRRHPEYRRDVGRRGDRIPYNRLGEAGAIVVLMLGLGTMIWRTTRSQANPSRPSWREANKSLRRRDQYHVARPLPVRPPARRLVISNLPGSARIYGTSEQQNPPPAPHSLNSCSSVSIRATSSTIRWTGARSSEPRGSTTDSSFTMGRTISDPAHGPTPDGGWVSTHEDITETGARGDATGRAA